MYLLKVKFTENTPQSVKNYYQSLSNNAQGETTISLMNPQQMNVAGREKKTINFEIQCEMRDGNNNLVSYYLFPKMSIANTPLMMADSNGKVDANFKSNLVANVRNMSVDVNCTVTNAVSLFHICPPTSQPIQVQIVSSFA